MSLKCWKCAHVPGGRIVICPLCGAVQSNLPHAEHSGRAWPDIDDEWLDDPRHGQAAGINRENRGRS